MITNVINFANLLLLMAPSVTMKIKFARTVEALVIANMTVLSSETSQLTLFVVFAAVLVTWLEIVLLTGIPMHHPLRLVVLHLLAET